MQITKTVKQPRTASSITNQK